MKSRRVVAAFAPAVLTSMAVVATAPPASADPLPTAHADIGVSYPTPTTFHVCAGGLADTTGEWVLEIDGLRGDGTQIHYAQTGFGPTFSTCVSPDISTHGTQAGNFEATLSFAHIPPIDTTSVQTSATSGLVALAAEEVDWTPQQDSNGVGM